MEKLWPPYGQCEPSLLGVQEGNAWHPRGLPCSGWGSRRDRFKQELESSNVASRNFGALRCSGDETLKPGHQFKDDPNQVANLVSLLGVANNTLNLMKDRESPELSYQVSDL